MPAGVGAARRLRRVFAGLAALLAFPATAVADEVWSPGEAEISAMGGALQALAVLRTELEKGPVNLCGFAPGLTQRTVQSVTATGSGVTLRCSGLPEPVVFAYRQRAIFGLNAMSRQDRLMFCETRDGGAIYGRKYESEEWACLESSARNGRFPRESVRRLVTAWTILSKALATVYPNEATVREQYKDVQPPTSDQQESLRRTQIQVELAIKENRLLDAAQLYRTALEATPGWPDGHFNRALLMADLEFYDSAIFHMRVYLFLEPDAPDARAVRDKIYEWEARVARGVGPALPGQ